MSSFLGFLKSLKEVNEIFIKVFLIVKNRKDSQNSGTKIEYPYREYFDRSVHILPF